ncbi:MAG: disulfide bond formation protein B [Betaproteobacteria bacterium]
MNASLTSPRVVLIAISITGALALLLAWVLQHRFDYQPCPWCVLQRLLLLTVVAVSLMGAVFRARVPQWLSAAATTLLSVVGVVVALYQHLVAAKSASCNLTLADRILSKTGLVEAWPAMFEATARCDEADRPWLGVPFSLWGAALFAGLAVVAAGLLIQVFRQRLHQPTLVSK